MLPEELYFSETATSDERLRVLPAYALFKHTRELEWDGSRLRFTTSDGRVIGLDVIGGCVFMFNTNMKASVFMMALSLHQGKKLPLHPRLQCRWSSVLQQASRKYTGEERYVPDHTGDDERREEYARTGIC